MGGMSYSSSNAANSRAINNTMFNSVEQNFTQIKEKKAHPTMKSQGIQLREARDSEVHPNSFPIIIALDLTGSMQSIPQALIQDGLPKMISSIIQGGVQSPALLFLGVGDHTCDHEPLQVGQFESGDVELDLWLSRTYLEGGGGGNEGESYSLAHYFAARHTVTDSFEKRGKKGVLVTIGDEPNLSLYPTRVINEIMGSTQGAGFSDVDMLAEVRERWEVFHINPKAVTSNWRDPNAYWKNFLGQDYIQVDDYHKVPEIIAELVIKVALKDSPKSTDVSDESAKTSGHDAAKPESGDKPTFL